VPTTFGVPSVTVQGNVITIDQAIQPDISTVAYTCHRDTVDVVLPEPFVAYEVAWWYTNPTCFGVNFRCEGLSFVVQPIQIPTLQQGVLLLLGALLAVIALARLR
jgi:hypothetical protein